MVVERPAFFSTAPGGAGNTVLVSHTSNLEEVAGVTLVAGFGHAPGTALGNVERRGFEHLSNLGLVLGAIALVRPLGAKRRSLRREVPFMIAAGALLFPLLANGALCSPRGSCCWPRSEPTSPCC